MSLNVPSSAAIEHAQSQIAARRMVQQHRADAGWTSALMGIGGTGDKIASMRFSGSFTPLSDPILEAMYMSEVYSAKLVDVYPNEAFREGLTYGQRADSDESKKCCEYLDETWRVPEVCTEGAVWGRLYGGAATWIVTDKDVGSLDTPLDPSEEIVALMTVDRPFLQPQMQPNLLDAAGRPTLYQVNPPTGGVHALVHVSRLVMWPGERTPKRRKIQNGFWDNSVLQRAYDVLKRNGHVTSAAQHLLSEASLGVLKIGGLWSALSSGQLAKFQQRIDIFNQSKSNARAVVLDKDGEDFARVNGSFAGVVELTQAAREDLAAAGDMPVTMLVGQAPGGLNATGDSDLRWFLMHVSAYQQHTLEAPVYKLVSALLNAAQSPCSTEGLAIGWPPLWTPSAVEASQIYSSTANADAAMINAEVLTAGQVATRYTGEGYSQQLDADPDGDGEMGAPEDLLPGETDPNAPLATGATGAVGPDGAPADVAKQAMNGAQVTALQAILADVSGKKLAPESAVQMLVLAFQLSEPDAHKLVDPAVAFEPKEDPKPAPFGGGPPKPAENGTEQTPPIAKPAPAVQDDQNDK